MYIDDDKFDKFFLETLGATHAPPKEVSILLDALTPMIADRVKIAIDKGLSDEDKLAFQAELNTGANFRSVAEKYNPDCTNIMKLISLELATEFKDGKLDDLEIPLNYPQSSITQNDLAAVLNKNVQSAKRQQNIVQYTMYGLSAVGFLVYFFWWYN